MIARSAVPTAGEAALRQGWKPVRVKVRPSGRDFSEADCPAPEGETPVQTCWLVLPRNSAQKLHAQWAPIMHVYDGTVLVFLATLVAFERIGLAVIVGGIGACVVARCM